MLTIKKVTDAFWEAVHGDKYTRRRVEPKELEGGIWLYDERDTIEMMRRTLEAHEAKLEQECRAKQLKARLIKKKLRFIR